MRKTFIIALLALTCMAGQAKEKTLVWENPAIEYGNTNGDGFYEMALEITKVELKKTETTIHMTVMGLSHSSSWFQFANDTYLKVGDKRYPVVSADGIELGTHQHTDSNHKKDVVFHFPPLPKGTKVFDFIEGDEDGAFQILGIKPVEERWKQIIPSYWRDIETGDWKIAFLEDCAIYDCKFWDYKQCNINPHTGEGEIIMCNGNDELKILIGKDKKGQRVIQIGQQKAEYNMITGRYLPDYPTKDTRTSFVDTGYKTDTITVIGWAKDMPEKFKENREIKFAYDNIFSDSQEELSYEMDESGRFTAKIPVLNTTEFFCDWERSSIHTPLEPGKTYFMLCDFKEGRRYIMGDDSRLQNEFIRFPQHWGYISRNFNDDFDKNIALTDSLIKAHNAVIDTIYQEHPTLSTRFYLYEKGDILWKEGEDFGMTRFHAPDYQFPENARKYAHDTFWTKLEKPYTLHRDITSFVRYYLGDIVENFSHINLLDFAGELASNKEEVEILARWKDYAAKIHETIKNATTEEERMRLAEEVNNKNADLIEKVDRILNSPKAQKVINGKMFLEGLKYQYRKIDSIGVEPTLKDLYLTQQFYTRIVDDNTPILPEVIDSVKVYIKNPTFIAALKEKNEYYIELENRKFDTQVLRSSDDLKDISEGEALLKKILEPFKGKLVLLDIWGTWCGPCKEALSHSQEEYKRLKDYDIAYVYLANGSPENAWKNVIQEYNVTGDNVAHYNLPAKQQQAIEEFLNINGYPTFMLFDREGNLYNNLKVDSRHLDRLEETLKQLE